MTAGKYNHYKLRHKKVERKCKYCNGIFTCLPNSKQKFCVMDCYHKSLISKRLSEKCYKNNKGFVGKHTEKTKIKISNTLKKYEFTEEHIKNLKIARRNQIRPIQDTTIEVKIQNFLKQLKIEFYTHYWMNIKHNYQCDILIPSMNLVIECFGDYWHKIPYGNQIDSLRCQELREKGYKVLVFWEREIRVMELNDFKRVICN